MSKKFMFYLLIIILTFFCVDSAFAANLFDPSAGDKSMEILNALFPGALGGGGSDAFAALFNVINSAALTIGGVFAAYTIMAGTIGTAHEGEMLGKKFSSIWVPIRTVVGTAGVVPASSGYSMIQILVMWLVVQGIGLADKAWDAFMSSGNIANITNVKLSTAAVNPVVQDLVKNVLISQTCMLGLAKEYAPGVPSVFPDPKLEMTTDTNAILTKYSFGSKAKVDNLEVDECGSVYSRAYIKIIDDGAINSTPDGTESFATAFTNAKNVAIGNLISEAESVAQTIVSGGTVAPATIENIGKNYQVAMQNAAKNALASSDPINQLSANMRADGWISAGSFFSKLAKIQANVNELASQVPGSTARSSPGKLSGWNPMTSSTYKSNLEKVYNTYVAQLNDVLKNTKYDNAYGVEKQDKAEKDNTAISKILSSILPVDNSANALFKPDPNDHPIITLQNWGSVLFTIGAGIVTAATAASLLPGVGGSIMVLITLLSVPLTILFTTAISMLYIIPMIPFFIWIGVLIGWFTMVMEAMIASPLWFVNHLNPYGSDLTGSAANGYRLVLGLVLRPVLMIAGIACALIFTPIFSTFLNKMFFSTFSLSNGTGLVGFFGFIIAPFIYVGIMITFLKKTFDLIHMVPDQIMNWIGGGGPQLGGYAGSMTQGAERMAGTVSQVAGQAGAALGHSANMLQQGRERGKQHEGQVAGMSAALGFDEGSAAANNFEAMNSQGAPGMFTDGNSKEFAKSKSMLDGHMNKLDSAGKAHYSEALKSMFANPDTVPKDQGDFRSKLGDAFKDALAAQASGTGSLMGAGEIIRGQMNGLGGSSQDAQRTASMYSNFASLATDSGQKDIPDLISDVAGKANVGVQSELDSRGVNYDVATDNYKNIPESVFSQLGGGNIASGKQEMHKIVGTNIQNQMNLKVKNW